MERRVFDCDQCKAKNIQPVCVSRQAGDEFVRVELCPACASEWISTLLGDAEPQTIQHLFRKAGGYV